MQAVNALGSKFNRGTEPECKSGGLKVVVDRFGHADYAQTLLVQLMCNTETSVPAYSDKRVEPVPAKLFEDFVRTIHNSCRAIRLLQRATKGIASVGCAQDRAAKVRDVTHGSRSEFKQSAIRIVLRFQKSLIAVADTKDLPP
jgi:hypothetical protein